MKIAFLNIYQGVVDRGAENFVKEISLRLTKKHQVDVYSALGQIKEEEARTQTPLNLFGKILYKFYLDSHSRRVLFFTLSILPRVIKGGYDWVIPVDGGWQLFLLKLIKLIRLIRAKILVSGQAGIGRDDLRNLRMRSDVFVALTRRAKEWAEQIKARGRVRVVYIPNGADLEKFNPQVKSAKVDLEKPVVLCVAGLNPYKRVDLTIQAVAKFKKGSLLLLGDGPQREEIDKIGMRDLGGRRYLRMTVSYDEMPKYYKAADLFTLVSESSEAFGSAYIEAMACGLPVVATDDQMRHEIVGEAGLFVDPTNIEKYAEALEQALKTDWSDKPRQQAEKFSWDRIASEYETVMKSFPGVPA